MRKGLSWGIPFVLIIVSALLIGAYSQKMLLSLIGGFSLIFLYLLQVIFKQ